MSTRPEVIRKKLLIIETATHLDALPQGSVVVYAGMPQIKNHQGMWVGSMNAARSSEKLMKDAHPLNLRLMAIGGRPI